MRYLITLSYDNLSLNHTALQKLDKAQDLVWICESTQLLKRVWSNKNRIAFFLAASRHFKLELEKKGYPLEYLSLEDTSNSGDLAQELHQAITKHKPDKVLCPELPEFHLEETWLTVCKQTNTPLAFMSSDHFLASRQDFADYAKGKKSLRMEFFYREMRKKYKILLDEENKPIGGKWNYDAQNRKAFTKEGPPYKEPLLTVTPNPTTQHVVQLVNEYFADHPGTIEHFDWPVTRKDSLKVMHQFLDDYLETFGDFQDAMWADAYYLFHSKLSAALNLKLLHPLEVIQAAEQKYNNGQAPLASVEGFIRQILGWREYVRGIYWLYMPKYLELNHLKAKEPLPEFYWTGQTDMNCLHQAVKQTLETGYAHHIQRLMVTGLFALTLGVRPQLVHEWYLAVYVDAHEWIELPNTLGMSQFGDGGILGSKPYSASGKYINRMSNYCKGCKYSPNETHGENACPFNVLYWDFLDRNEKALRNNPRMGMQYRNLDRISAQDMVTLRQRSKKIKSSFK